MNMRTHSYKMIAVLALVMMTAVGLASCGCGGGGSGSGGGGGDQMTIMPRPSSQNAPDLEIGAPTVSNSGLVIGASFTLSATVRNAGGVGSATTTLRYYRSTDATITTSDTVVGTEAVAVLAASGSSNGSVDLTAPSTAGTYYYGACVDTVTGESDTTNNCSPSVEAEVTVLETQTTLPGQPDLEVGVPTVSDSTPETGASFTLSATVSNTGDGGSPATTLRYYRSTDSTITTADTAVGTDAVVELAAARSSAESIPLTAPLTAGAYHYGACVDAVTDESDTTNNCSASVKVDAEAPKYPDLEVGTPTVSDSTPETGASFTLSATVSNAGDAESAATTLSYYRSTDSTITTADTAVGTDAVGALSATTGASAESISLMASVTAGAYYYGACVNSVTGESDTTDNCSSAVEIIVLETQQQVQGQPDLTIALYGSQSAGTISLSVQLRNSGDETSAATTLRYYQSADATITASDTEVGTVAVDASDLSLKLISLTAPTATGTYYYGACLDAVAGESNTANNCSRSVSVTVPTPKPDLEVSTFSVDDITLNAGQTITMTAVLRNAGDVQSAASTLRFYLSSDSTISSSDTQVYMGEVEALDDLRAGTTAVQVLLDAPAPAGTYYYGACVDTVSGETNTTNNCSGAVTVTVTAVTE